MSRLFFISSASCCWNICRWAPVLCIRELPSTVIVIIFCPHFAHFVIQRQLPFAIILQCLDENVSNSTYTSCPWRWWHNALSKRSQLFNSRYGVISQGKGKGKGKVRPRTGHVSPEGENRYSSTLSLTSALDGSGWLTPRPGRFTPGKRSGTYCLGGRMGSTGAENFAPTGIRSPRL
jgi:hypothetical protein